MPIINESQLAAPSRALYLKAYSAMEMKNYGYAVSLLQAVLKEQPAFLDGRKMLRKAEVANTKGKKSFLSGISSASMKGAGMVKKDPNAAMELAEKTLESDPYNPQANHLLKDAAKAAGLPEVAAFALETLVEASPKDTKVMHELGEHYSAMGEAEKAVTIYTKITELNPADMVAVKRSKDAAASATMKSGGWESAKSYRDVMKNSDEAVSLEQKGRQVKDVGAIDAQAAELYQQLEAMPENADLARRIAALYEQKVSLIENDKELAVTVPEVLAAAIQYYEYADGLLKGSDPGVARKVSDLKAKQRDQEITGLESWLAEHGESYPDEAAGYRQQLEERMHERAEQRISEAKRRVERNPTDLGLRFELGERLLEVGNFGDAITELQMAKRHANVRLKAMSLLGRCFAQKGMLDMAASQFEAATAEMTAMDATKKDTLYDLAMLYERMRQRDKYVRCIKEIAEVDYGYRDVARRIEQTYGEETAAA